MRWAIAIAALLAQPAGWKAPSLRIQQGGSTRGYVSTINCSTGMTCTVGASSATFTASGGGGSATPGGSSGNVQINSAGAFGAYLGTTCAYAVKSLDANGAATCTASPSIPFPAGVGSELQIRASGTAFGTYAGASCPYAVQSLSASGAATCQAAPTIPADISSAHYVTTQAEAGLSAEAVLPTCTGTDKLTFNGTAVSCATDATGSGAPTTATYITQTPDATLGAEQALSSLSTGLLKVTTGTGVLSTAAAGTDYQAPLTLPLSAANGGLGAAQPTCSASQHVTCNGTTCSCSADTGGSGPSKLCGFQFGSTAATSGAVTCTAAQMFYCLVNVAGYGGADMVSFRFNADSTAADYHARWINFSNATTPVVSSVNFTTGGNIQMGPTAITAGRSILLACSNLATKRKICTIQEQEEATSQTTFSQLSMGYGEWFNTAAQITSIEMKTNGGQTLLAGSGFVCYGGTPP
jgi:hypothetical protein